MEPAKLEKLHADLSTAAAGRGGAHGGLGFDGSGKAKADGKATAAGKALLNDGGGKKKREYHATTAGAVAAGHWDPWARPVEFKMKQVNRTANTLATMFVRGGVEGNTLAEPAAAPSASADAAAPAAAAASFNWKKEIKAQLRAAPGRTLRVGALRKAVLAAYGARVGGAAVGRSEQKGIFKAKLEKSGASREAGKMVVLR